MYLYVISMHVCIRNINARAIHACMRLTPFVTCTRQALQCVCRTTQQHELTVVCRVQGKHFLEATGENHSGVGSESAAAMSKRSVQQAQGYSAEADSIVGDVTKEGH
jgi:hypothetical protein